MVRTTNSNMVYSHDLLLTHTNTDKRGIHQIHYWHGIYFFRYRHQPKLISYNWNFKVQKVSLKTAASEQRNFCTFHRGTLRNGQSKFRITQKGDLRAQKVGMIRVQKPYVHIYFYNDGKTTIQYHKASNKVCNKWICCVKPRWFAFSSKGSFAVSYNFLMMYPIDVYYFNSCLIYYLPLRIKV